MSRSYGKLRSVEPHGLLAFREVVGKEEEDLFVYLFVVAVL